MALQVVVSHDQPLNTHSIEHTVPWHRMAPCPHIRAWAHVKPIQERMSPAGDCSKAVPLMSPSWKNFQNDCSVCSAHEVNAVPFEAICEEYFTKVAPYLQSFVPARMQQNVMQGPSLANLLQTPETQSLNLTVLRRIDSAITQVLACANHVALYDFDRVQHRWVRKDVEGSFFLIQRSALPVHQIIILNKKNAENYVEDLLPDLGFELTLPYIMYRNKADEVVGVWFYEEAEARKVAALLHHISSQHKGATSETAVTSVQAVQTGETSSAPTVLAPASYDGSSSEARGRPARQAREDGFWDRPVKQHHAEDHIPTILQRCGSPQAPACQMGPHTWITQPGDIPLRVNAARDESSYPLQPNPLEKLFAKMKVPENLAAPTLSSGPNPQMPVTIALTTDTASTGTSLLDGGLSMCGAAAPPSQPPRPALLTPKFLAAAKSQAKMHVTSTSLVEPNLAKTQATSTAFTPSSQTEEKDESSLTRFFTQASKPTPAEPSLPECDATTSREKLRTAIRALSQSDAFLDILAKELSATGLLD